MSGKRQHYIPQFLQRGFVSHYKGEAAYTWVYRKDSEPQNQTIRKSGFQNWFYTDSEEADADSIITANEGEFANTVNQLRAENSVDGIDATTIAALVAHCEIRTRTLRERFKSMGHFVTEQFCKVLEDPEVFLAFLQQELAKDPTFLDESIRGQLSESGVEEDVIEWVISNRTWILEAAMPTISEGVARNMGSIRADLPRILKESAKTGHVSAMQEEVAPDVRVRRYAQLTFYVVETQRVNIPLGDSITVFIHERGASISSFCDKWETVDCVILPISSRQIIVGQATTYCPRTLEIPRLIARVSHEQFVADEDAVSHREISKEIGEAADLMSQEELLNIVNNTLAGAAPANS